MNEDLISYKVIMLGPQNAGKTSILEGCQYGKKSPIEVHQTNLMEAKILEFQTLGIRLDTWELNYQLSENPRYEALNPIFCRGAKAVLIVIPINMKHKNAKAYINKYINTIKNDLNLKDTKRVLIFSKSDLRNNKSLTDSQLNELWSLLETDISYFICSANNNENIEEIFSTTAKRLGFKEYSWPNINNLDEAVCKQILDGLRIKIEKQPSWELNFFGGSRIDLVNEAGTKTNIKAPDGIARICEVLNYFASHKHPIITYKEALEQIIFILQSKLNNINLSRNNNTSRFYRDTAQNISDKIKANLTTIGPIKSHHH